MVVTICHPVVEMKSLKDRIIDRVEFVGDCWIWNGPTKGFGYGYMTIGSRKDGTRKTETSHRVSYIAFNGSIDDDSWVLHKCDNPRCCNPDHLYLGDRERNVKDMMDRGRLNHVFGEACQNAKLNDDDVINIRNDRYINKTPYRVLAKRYGLKSHKSIYDICSGKSWSHLPLPEPPK